MSIPNDIIGSANVSYLGDPFEQYCGLNGKPLIGGHIEVYLAGTSDKYMTLQDFDGDYNPFKVPLGADGRVVMLADPSLTYDIYVYNSYNDLVCSRLNVECTCPGNISIKGADTWVRNTDGTLDISLRTSANNRRVFDVNTRNKRLDVQSPLYFVENSETATVIGFSGDDYATTADLADKMDNSKLEYNEDGEISAYDGSAFAGQGGAGDPEVNELVHSNSAEWNDVSAKLDTTAFSTVSGNFLTAIPDNYATKDYVQSSVSSKLDSTAFSTVSGSFLTAHQSLDGLMSASLLGMSGSTITSYNNMPFPLGGGEGDAEVNQIVHANSADWNNVSAKLDTTAFSAVSGNFLTAHQSLADYLTKASADTLYQPAGDYATHDDLTAYQTVEGMTAYQPTGDYATHDDLTAYQPVGDYYSASNPSGFITNDAITGLQPSGDYATHDDLTAYQPIGDYADASALDSKVDTSSFTAFSSTTNEKIEYISGALSGSYELSAGSGINITDYPNEQKTVISVTAQGGNPEVENLVIANSATWDSVTSKADATALNDYATTAQLANKLDTTAFSTVSGNFITAHQDISNLMPKSESANFYPMTGNPSGFLTAHQNLSDYATTAELADKLDTTAFSDVSGSFITAHQDISNLMQKSESANFYPMTGNPSGFLTAHQDLSDYATTAEVADKLDTTAFSTVSSDFLTAHQDLSNYATTASVADKLDTTAFSTVSGNFLTAVDLTPYQTTAGMTAYQEAGDYYSASNPSGFLTAVPAGTMNESNFSYDASNNITAYNGSAFNAGGGGDFPQSANDAINYVTANSGDIDSTIDNVSANSAAWGGEKLPIIAGNGIALSYNSTALTISAVPASFYSAGISNIVLTASMPGSPDANTLYLIPE